MELIFRIEGKDPDELDLTEYIRLLKELLGEDVRIIRIEKEEEEHDQV